MSMEDVVRFGEVLEEMVDELKEPGESKQQALDRITGKDKTTVSKSVAAMGSAPKPRHRLCWWCNLQFRGNHFATRTIDGHERQIHKRCAKLHDQGNEPNWGMG